MNSIRVGTRGSKLALAQTDLVVAQLSVLHPTCQFEICVIKTTGDLAVGPLPEVGTKGMFVKEIEEALLANEIDIAIHSLKDMPGEFQKGLCGAAVIKRADPRDALVSNGMTLNELPKGSRVGTGSPRRSAQLKAARQDLNVIDIRGNVDTRLRKFDNGQFDAIVLACAGLERLGLSERISQRIPIEVMVPAPGQGTLLLEVRCRDARILTIVDVLNDDETFQCTLAERAFQNVLNAGCSVPAGALASVEGTQLSMVAIIAAPDGTEILRTEVAGIETDPAAIGRMAAQNLLERGGRRWLRNEN